MSYAKTPHACFKVKSTSFGSAEDELPQTLAKYLQTRLASVRVRKMPFFGSWAIEVKVGPGSSFTVMLDKSKYGDNEWVLVLGSPTGSSLLDFMRRRDQTSHPPQLIQACRDIHTYLTSIPGITEIRWYFEGFHSQSAAVVTPDELLWSRARGNP